MLYEENHEEIEFMEMSQEELESVAGGKKGKTYVMATADANLRTGPGTDYASLGKAKPGKTAIYKETQADKTGAAWYKVSVHGTTCWISAKYAKIV